MYKIIGAGFSCNKTFSGYDEALEYATFKGLSYDLIQWQENI